MRNFDDFVKSASMESPNDTEKKHMHEEECAIDQPVAKEDCAGCRKSKLSADDKRKLLKMLNLTEAVKK